MMKGKKKGFNLIILFLLLTFISKYLINSYAKYTSKVEINVGTATAAKWKFDADNAEKTLTINLAENLSDLLLDERKIAPGTSGSFEVLLVNGTTETDVDFTVKLKNISNNPTNLKFYKDENHTKKMTPGTDTITGQLAAKDATGVSIPIYWVWELGTSYEETNAANKADTLVGETIDSLTIGVDIIGAQTKPSDTKVETHVDPF